MKGKKIALKAVVVALITALELASCALPLQPKIGLEGFGEPPIRVAHVTDLHITKATKLLDDTFAALDAAAPDLIVFTGDLVESDAGLPLLTDYLSRLPSGIPAYACLGNWEHKGLDLAAYRAVLEGAGVRLLINEGLDIVVKGRPVRVFAVDDYLTSMAGDGRVILDFSAFEPWPGALNLFLSHCPGLFDAAAARLAEAAPFVMLSGHTHGGQVTLLGLPLVTPPGSGPYVAGHYSIGKHHLFVSKGIGNSGIDLRLFADPELPVYTL
jgi:hypothetical protein